MIKYLITRKRMLDILQDLNSTWKYNDIYSSELVRQNYSSKLDQTALQNLVQCECLIADKTLDGGLSGYRQGTKSHVYILGRQELTFNRIVSFLLGVLTTLTANYLLTKF